MSLRSPMGVALGKGAAGGAVRHWWLQRVTAIALVPLTLWLVFSLTGLRSLDYGVVLEWLASGWTALWMSLFIVASVWHSMLGVQVVIEDYVGAGARTVVLLLSQFAHLLVGAASLFAVFRIALR